MALTIRKSRVPPPDGCPRSACMNLIGRAWTSHVIWQLSAGPRRFGELRTDIPAISAKVLTARLRELEHTDIVERRTGSSSPPSIEYALTSLGRELMPLIQAIVSVGTRLRHQRTQEAAPASGAHTRPARAESHGASVDARHHP